MQIQLANVLFGRTVLARQGVHVAVPYALFAVLPGCFTHTLYLLDL